MKQFYLALVFIVTCTSAIAQQDFRKGYIVLEGDTIRGLIDYRGKVRSSQVAVFKQTDSADEQAFTPDDIQGYGFDKEQKQYESLIVPASTAGAATQKTFLNVLVKGKASLYHYRDSNQRENYYIAKGMQPLVALTQETGYRTNPTNGKKYKFINKDFIQVLRREFSDCSSLSPAQLAQVELKKKSLTAIFYKYNQCIAPAAVAHIQQIKKAKVTIAPIFSYTMSALEVKGDHHLAKRDYKNDGTPYSGGIGFNVPVPNLNEKLSVQIDILYTPQKFVSVYTFKEPIAERTTTSEIVFDFVYLKLPVQLRYTIPTGKLRPFVNAGPLLAYAAKSGSMESTQVTYPTSSTTENGPAVSDEGIKPFAIGYTSGIGLSYPIRGKALSLEARYEVNDGFSTISRLSTKVVSTYFVLSYAL